MEAVLVYLQFIPVQLPATCRLDDERQAIKYRLTDSLRLQSSVNIQLVLVKHSKDQTSKKALPGDEKLKWLWQDQQQYCHKHVMSVLLPLSLQKSPAAVKSSLALVPVQTSACQEANPVFTHCECKSDC